MRRTKLVRIGAVIVFSAFVVGACGSDASDTAVTTVAPETTAQSVPSTTMVALESDGSAVALAALEDAARTEGKLTIYISQGTDVVDATIAKFNEDYPSIRVDYIRLASGPLANRFASEAEAGVHEADIVNLAAPDLFVDSPELFLELDETVVPAFGTWPSEFAKGHFVETGMSAHVMFYNTDLVKESELPMSWDDLLDERWAGRAIVLDPRATPTYMSFYQVMAEEFGDEFLNKWAAQGFTWAESGGSASQQVAAGAYDAAFPVVLAHNVDLRAQGAPVAIHEIPPVHGYPHLFALPAQSKNPNAGRLFMHWLLTPAGQAANCADVYAPIIELQGSSCPPLSKSHAPARFGLDDERQAFILGELGLQ